VRTVRNTHIHCVGSPYFTGNISRLRYRAQPVNTVWGNSRFCCENRTEHTDIVCTSQETHHVSATEPNRLMLCGERVAVCCENRTEHTDTLWAVCTSQGTHRYTVWTECGIFVLNQAAYAKLLNFERINVKASGISNLCVLVSKAVVGKQ
jgi:hypothetical protein